LPQPVGLSKEAERIIKSSPGPVMGSVSLYFSLCHLPYHSGLRKEQEEKARAIMPCFIFLLATLALPNWGLSALKEGAHIRPRDGGGILVAPTSWIKQGSGENY
jgi:hypothetical protein